MAELVARWDDLQHQWRRTLPAEQITMGRSAQDSIWDVPWEPKISRKHAALAWQGDRLRVTRLPTARNPILFGGEPCDEFTVKPDEQFVIGTTTFTLLEKSDDLPPPLTELTCSSQELQQVPYVDASELLEVLATLPKIIRCPPRRAGPGADRRLRPGPPVQRCLTRSGHVLLHGPGAGGPE
jgi:adenylate cyclase